MTKTDRPLKLSRPRRNPVRRILFSLVERPLERFLHFPELNRIYASVAGTAGHELFLENVLDELEVRYQVAAEDLERIPTTGPLIVVANHPYGAIEGIVLACLLRSVRPDVKVMANYLLNRIPELRRYMIFVDPFGRKDSPRYNAGPIKQAVRWLRDEEGVLAIFPAGEVSHLNLKTRIVSDPPWQKTVARLVRMTKAPVLPIFFEGSNNVRFQLAGIVHPRLRTALLPSALLKTRRKTLGVRIGNPVPFSRLETFDDDGILDYLRMRTYMLNPKTPRRSAPRKTWRSRRQQRRPRPEQPIVDAVDPALLASEVADLPDDQRLVESGEYDVLIARMHQAPHVVREIGRLREIAFRAAGEGTGAAIDLDRFDRYYDHLFVWNRLTHEVVGAYRLGRTEEVLRRFGPKGLYTRTLFRFPRRFLEQLNPAFELGRSFVRLEYQRKHSPLALLWRGIGVLVVRDPRCKYLFGPVSISNAYRSVSQHTMISFIEAHQDLTELDRLIRPRNPLKWQTPAEVRACTQLLTDIKEVSQLISEIELDRKGVPILLRQYMQLNARFVSFNVDPDFSDVVDVLMVTDLTQTEPRILERHMGKEGAARVLEYHARKDAEEAAFSGAPT